MIVRGEGELLVPAHLNFGKLFLNGLRNANPEVVCLENRNTGDKITYREFTQYAVSLSASLSALGVRSGDTVAVASEPHIKFLAATIGVVFTGAAFTPIELHCGRAILAYKCNLTKPRYFICSRLFWQAYSDVLKSFEFVHTFICFEDVEDMLSVKELVSRDVDVDTFEPVDVDGQTDVAVVVYSSGTTGMSKGILLTHLNCIANVISKWYHNFETLQTCFFIEDQYGTYAFFLIFAFLCAGKKVVYVENYERELVLKTIQDCQVDTMATIPTFVEFLVNDTKALEHDLSSLKIIYTAAAPLDPVTAKSFKQRYPNLQLLQLYGASETGVLTVQRPSDREFVTSVGVAIAGNTIKVVDIETGANLGPNQRGEICARGPCLMKGYLGGDSSGFDEEGYYRTGDLGYYDDHNRFYLLGRLKDIISYIGDKVSPEDVEAVLKRHEAVLDAGVVGKPTALVGEVPAAFVVLRPGAVATETEIIHYVDKEVSCHMRLRGGVRFVSELPRNPRGKMLRRELKQMLN